MNNEIKNIINAIADYDYVNFPKLSDKKKIIIDIVRPESNEIEVKEIVSFIVTSIFEIYDGIKENISNDIISGKKLRHFIYCTEDICKKIYESEDIEKLIADITTRITNQSYSDNNTTQEVIIDNLLTLTYLCHEYKKGSFNYDEDKFIHFIFKEVFYHSIRCDLGIKELILSINRELSTPSNKYQMLGYYRKELIEDACNKFKSLAIEYNETFPKIGIDFNSYLESIGSHITNYFFSIGYVLKPYGYKAKIEPVCGNYLYSKNFDDFFYQLNINLTNQETTRLIPKEKFLLMEKLIADEFLKKYKSFYYTETLINKIKGFLQEYPHENTDFTTRYDITNNLSISIPTIQSNIIKILLSHDVINTPQEIDKYLYKDEDEVETKYYLIINYDKLAKAILDSLHDKDLFKETTIIDIEIKNTNYTIYKESDKIIVFDNDTIVHSKNVLNLILSQNKNILEQEIILQHNIHYGFNSPQEKLIKNLTNELSSMNENDLLEKIIEPFIKSNYKQEYTQCFIELYNKKENKKDITNEIIKFTDNKVDNLNGIIDLNILTKFCIPILEHLKSKGILHKLTSTPQEIDDLNKTHNYWLKISKALTNYYGKYQSLSFYRKTNLKSIIDILYSNYSIIISEFNDNNKILRYSDLLILYRISSNRQIDYSLFLRKDDFTDITIEQKIQYINMILDLCYIANNKQEYIKNICKKILEIGDKNEITYEEKIKISGSLFRLGILNKNTTLLTTIKIFTKETNNIIHSLGLIHNTVNNYPLDALKFILSYICKISSINEIKAIKNRLQNTNNILYTNFSNTDYIFKYFSEEKNINYDQEETLNIYINSILTKDVDINRKTSEILSSLSYSKTPISIIYRILKICQEKDKHDDFVVNLNYVYEYMLNYYLININNITNDELKCTALLHLLLCRENHINIHEKDLFKSITSNPLYKDKYKAIMILTIDNNIHEINTELHKTSLMYRNLSVEEYISEWLTTQINKTQSITLAEKKSLYSLLNLKNINTNHLTTYFSSEKLVQIKGLTVNMFIKSAILQHKDLNQHMNILLDQSFIENEKIINIFITKFCFEVAAQKITPEQVENLFKAIIKNISSLYFDDNSRAYKILSIYDKFSGNISFARYIRKNEQLVKILEKLLESSLKSPSEDTYSFKIENVSLLRRVYCRFISFGIEHNKAISIFEKYVDLEIAISFKTSIKSLMEICLLFSEPNDNTLSFDINKISSSYINEETNINFSLISISSCNYMELLSSISQLLTKLNTDTDMLLYSINDLTNILSILKLINANLKFEDISNTCIQSLINELPDDIKQNLSLTEDTISELSNKILNKHKVVELVINEQFLHVKIIYNIQNLIRIIQNVCMKNIEISENNKQIFYDNIVLSSTKLCFPIDNYQIQNRTIDLEKIITAHMSLLENEFFKHLYINRDIHNIEMISVFNILIKNIERILNAQELYVYCSKMFYFFCQLTSEYKIPFSYFKTEIAFIFNYISCKDIACIFVTFMEENDYLQNIFDNKAKALMQEMYNCSPEVNISDKISELCNRAIQHLIDPETYKLDQKIPFNNHDQNILNDTILPIFEKYMNQQDYICLLNMCDYEISNNINNFRIN